MKKTAVFLGLSLVANVTLLAIFWLRPSASKPVPTPFVTTSSPQARTTSSGKPDPAAELSVADQASLIRAQSLLATDDLPTLVTRLRAAGFSPLIIRAMVSARLSEIYGARRKAAVAHLEVVPYWRSSQSFPHNPPVGAEVRNLFREQSAQFTALLGPDSAATDEWSQLMEQRQFGYLPPEKIAPLKRIVDDYNDLQSAIYNETQGIILPEDQAKLALLQKERRADLAELLTPEELEAYELRTSNIANQLRHQLSAFRPTEEEFRAIYALAQAAQPPQQNPFSFTFSSDLFKQIETMLGPDRAAIYRMTTDPAYQQIDRIATRLTLPAAIIPQIYSTSKELQQRAQALQSDSTLSNETRSSQLAALATEGESKLTALLGPRGFEIYQNQTGRWLTKLKPKSVNGSN
jgi:hypothetical protein